MGATVCNYCLGSHLKGRLVLGGVDGVDGVHGLGEQALLPVFPWISWERSLPSTTAKLLESASHEAELFWVWAIWLQ